MTFATGPEARGLSGTHHSREPTGCNFGWSWLRTGRCENQRQVDLNYFFDTVRLEGSYESK
jgi:hypothetical protein